MRLHGHASGRVLQTLQNIDNLVIGVDQCANIVSVTDRVDVLHDFLL